MSGNASTFRMPTEAESQALHIARTFLEHEGVLLDQQRWNDWLALYRPDCIYWVPARRANETLTDDPETQLSHIYYASRAGLEDRILRIASGRSPASTPMPRTTHLIGNLHLRESVQAGRIAVSASWITQVFFVRSRQTHAFFGSVDVDLVENDGQWQIGRRRTVLQNDYVPTMLDVYCL
jgi:3-phenylpropionate/cinnamic acid dioxygenase small subunit